MSSSSRSTLCTVALGFSEQDVAFALAWEVHAPGLGGWSVTVDTCEERGDLILVDPPLVFGDGFELRPNPLGGVVITSALGTHRARSVREALLLICPLARDTLDAVDALASLPEAAR